MNRTEKRKRERRRNFTPRLEGGSSENRPSAAVEEMIRNSSMTLELVTGEAGLQRRLRRVGAVRLSLPLEDTRAERMEGSVQLLRPSVVRYLAGLNSKECRRIVSTLAAKGVAAIVVTAGQTLPSSFVEEMNRRELPLFLTREPFNRSARKIGELLKVIMAEEMSAHGVLVEISGVGVLITGASGIGKSESALELVMRGHRLIADDLVLIRPAGDGQLRGRGAEMDCHYMEIRGLGIINIRDLFGVAAVLDSKIIELVVELEEWDPRRQYDRLGLDDRQCRIGRSSLPYLRIPVNHGRNMAVILEVAARNHLLKRNGCFSARRLEQALTHRIRKEGGER